jgi:hypothetical protein
VKFHHIDFDFFVPKQLDFCLSSCKVLDLASHTGESSICCSERGATSVIGLEPRLELVQQAIDLADHNKINNVEYIVGDATDKDQLTRLLTNIDTVITFGMFYHIADHNLMLKTICESGAKHLIIETEFGPESPNPSADWYVEKTDWLLAGHNGYTKILAGVPNLKWIKDCLSIYGWEINYYKAFYQGYPDNPRQRMIICAVNSKFYEVKDQLPEDIWEWHIEPNCIVGKEFLSEVSNILESDNINAAP